MGFNQFVLSPAMNEWMSVCSLGPSGTRLPWPLPTAQLLSAPHRSLQHLWLSLAHRIGLSRTSLTPVWASIYLLPAVPSQSSPFSAANLCLRVLLCWLGPFCCVMSGPYLCHWPINDKALTGGRRGQKQVFRALKVAFDTNWRIKMAINNFLFY